MLPRVTYLVASYNHEAWIDRTLASIEAQDERDLEIIVVDDGSTDRTSEIIRAHADRDSRVRFIPQRNTGVVAARNRAFQEASGEYVSIVDSDDLLPLDRTTLLASSLDSSPTIGLAYGDAMLIDEHDAPLIRFSSLHPPLHSDDIASTLWSTYCFVPAISAMFRRSIANSLGPLWGSGPSSDYLRWIELSLKGEVVRRPEILGFWRRHSASVSLAGSESLARHYAELARDLELLLEKHPELSVRIPDDVRRRRLAHCHFVEGFHYTAGGDRVRARHAFDLAHRLSPHWRTHLGKVSTCPLMFSLSSCLARAVRRARRGS
jgi:glycosyltransferase involved in cell wall biosynthesis